MSRFGWLALILALFGLAFWLKGNGASPAPGKTPPKPARTFLDGRLETIDRAQAAVNRANDALWRQREGLAKASPGMFAKDLEASSAQTPFTRAEADRALAIARANGIAADWEGKTLRIGGLVVQVSP